MGADVSTPDDGSPRTTDPDTHGPGSASDDSGPESDAVTSTRPAPASRGRVPRWKSQRGRVVVSHYGARGGLAHTGRWTPRAATAAKPGSASRLKSRPGPGSHLTRVAHARAPRVGSGETTPPPFAGARCRELDAPRRSRSGVAPAAGPVVVRPVAATATATSLPADTDTDGGFTTDPGAGSFHSLASQPGATLLDVTALSVFRATGATRDYASDVTVALRMSIRLRSVAMPDAAQCLIMRNAVVIKVGDADDVAMAADALVARFAPAAERSRFVAAATMMHNARAQVTDPSSLVYMEGVVTSPGQPSFTQRTAWVANIKTGAVMDISRVRGEDTPDASSVTYVGVPIRLTQELRTHPAFCDGGALAVCGHDYGA